MALHDLTLQDLIRKNAALHGDATAFISGNERVPFGRFARDVERLAAGLASLKVTKGDRIGVLTLNCYEFFLLYGAASWLGAVIVPINWRQKSDEVGYVIQDTAPKVMVVSAEFVENVTEVVDQCPSVKQSFVIGESAAPYTNFAEIQEAGSTIEPAEVSQQDPLLIIHTAAIEGRPRGAVLSHGNMVASGFQVAVPMGIQAGEVYVNLLPLFHIMDLTLATGVMLAGGCNAIVRRFEPASAAACIEEERAALIGTVPPMLSSILDAAEASGRSLQSLRVVASLFDHEETVRRCQEITGAVFWVGFGQTETAGYLTLSPYDERPGSSGREGPMARMRVVDDYDRDVIPGTEGEIVVRGPVVFLEYWNLKEETAYTSRTGWHHTGDVGRLDESGYLWYVGRKAEKELIKPGGENVYPAEVEKVLLEHPDVCEACVFGVADKEWGEAIKAVVAVQEGCQHEPLDLIDFVGSRIAGYKKPKYVAFVKSLPKKDDGTVDREQVKSHF